MTAVAVLTYNRMGALSEALKSIVRFTPWDMPIAVFEDCGQKDGTRKALMHGSKYPIPEMLADKYSLSLGHDRSVQAYVGQENLGVAGNSNRAIKWFMDNTGADHLLLCNDDLEFTGDAGKAYYAAHKATGIGLFCMCDFASPQFKCTPTVYRGTRLKILSRMTGIMMSMTRNLVEDIGYFDTQFGPFGEEHCDYTVRARYAGHQTILERNQYCIDLENPPVKHQVVPSTISPEDKPEFDRIASQAMAKKSTRYAYTSGYVPFSLVSHPVTDGIGSSGIESDLMTGYQIV